MRQILREENKNTDTYKRHDVLFCNDKKHQTLRWGCLDLLIQTAINILSSSRTCLGVRESCLCTSYAPLISVQVGSHLLIGGVRHDGKTGSH